MKLLLILALALSILYINFIKYKNDTYIFTSINLDNINNNICIEEINSKLKSEIIKNHLIFYNECNNKNINKENRLVFFINDFGYNYYKYDVDMEKIWYYKNTLW